MKTGPVLYDIFKYQTPSFVCSFIAPFCLRWQCRYRKHFTTDVEQMQRRRHHL